MDYMSNKALIIAVSLIVTMAISSAVLFTINQVTGIYKTVYETDTLIQSNFDEFDAYDGAVKTKLDLLNAAKKYKDNESVYVVIKDKSDFTELSNDNEKEKRAKDSQVGNTFISNLESKNEIGSLGIDKEGVPGKVIVESTENASVEYDTYVIRLNSGKVIIGFTNKSK